MCLNILNSIKLYFNALDCGTESGVLRIFTKFDDPIHFHFAIKSKT